MLKSKSAMFSVAAGLLVTSLLFAGMAVTSTSVGAGTDSFNGGGPTSLPPAAGAPVANPPAAPIEPPATVPGAGTNPAGTTPDGDQAGAGAGPDALPSAGFGTTGGDSFTTLVVLLGLAGAALAGAGATAISASRRD